MLRKLVLLVWLIALILIVSGRTAAQDSTGPQTLTLTVDGLDRTFTVTLPPASDDQQPAPLLIALHPFASSGRAMEALTGLDRLAEEQGFIVVYPDSYDLDWNDGQAEFGWPSGLRFVDDVSFITALLDHLQETYTVDPQRIYLAGFAAGGDMATHLVCTLPDRFAKVALVNALAWDYHVSQCGASVGPLSVLLLHGAENLDRPGTGREVQSDDDSMTTRVLGTAETAQFWAEKDGCDLETIQTSSVPDAIVYATCPAATSVSLYTFQGMGNHWPRTGDYTLNQFGVDATDLLAQFFTTDGAPAITQDGTGKVYGGEGRSYLVYVPPSYDPATPLPLVMVLHGRFGNGSSAAYVYDMNQVARRAGFIVVYPDGTHIDGTIAGREWNYLRGTTGYPLYGTDDVDFLGTLVNDLARDLSIDQTRLYVTGYSNGGFMTQRLACSAPERWAAFASISASLAPGVAMICQDQPPVSLLLMHGTLDDNIPWNGLMYGDQLELFSVPDTAIFWAMHDGCDPQSLDYTLLPRLDPEAISQVHRYIFSPCANGSEFDYYVIDGGGHTVPGTANRQVWAGADAVNMDIHAGEVIWEFFQRHALP